MAKRKTESVKRGMVRHVLPFLDAQQAAGDASELFDGIERRDERDIDAAIEWIRSQFSSDHSPKQP